MSNKKELTEKHKMFCERYLITHNATQSYLYAYPNAKESTARNNASKLLKRQDVQDYLKDVRQKVYSENIDTIENVLIKLKNIYDGVATTKKTLKIKGEPQEVEVYPTFSERLKAMQLYIVILGYNNVYGNDYYYVDGETFTDGSGKDAW